MPAIPESSGVTSTPVAQEPEAREALESTVSTALSSIFTDGDEELSDVVADKPSEEAEESAAAPKPSEEESAAKEEEKTAEPEKVAAKDPAEKPTVESKPVLTGIPAAYTRSLKAYGWSDEEIANANKVDSAGFLKMAERVHQNRNEETKRWVELGRSQKAKTPAGAPKAEAKPTVDFKALRDKYGNEPFIDAMEQQHAALEQAKAFISASQSRQQTADTEAFTKQVDNYFGGEGMTAYHDVYGKMGQTLTDKQITERTKVLETADLLISGARAMGRPMTLDEALTMAHDSVSSPIREQVAVKKVKTAIQQRQQAITLRPGSRAAAPAAKTRTDLETKVRGKLATIFK